MKKSLQLFTAVFLLLFASSLEAQYGYGNRYGRRTSIPQAQTPQKEPEAKTAEEYVEEGGGRAKTSQPKGYAMTGVDL